MEKPRLYREFFLFSSSITTSHIKAISKIAVMKSFIDPAEDLNEEFDPYTAQDDLDDAQEQLQQDQYAARLEEDEHFEERTERIIETSKSALAPRTLKAYNSFVPIFF